MMRPILILILVCVTASAEDVLFLRSGEKRSGRLAGLDEKSYRLQVPLPPAPGMPAGGAPMFATVTISRADVAQIEFAPDPVREEKLKTATPDRIAEVDAIWTALSPWLGVPRSPAGRAGCVLGGLLLQSGDPAKAGRAVELFSQIEAAAWSEADRMAARQGRLRAMVASGRAKGAVREAGELAAVTENPEVLIEAKFLLATAAEAELRKFLEDNPRWQDDAAAIPERSRLYNESLDLYLFPALFYGSDSGPAARGLWRAAKVYQLCGEPARATECARDIVAMYPGSSFAREASDLIASLPEDVRSTDPEKEAREGVPPKAEAPDPAPDDKPIKKTTRKKTNEKKTQK